MLSKTTADHKYRAEAYGRKDIFVTLKRCSKQKSLQKFPFINTCTLNDVVSILYIVQEGLNGVNRQPSNGQKINRQRLIFNRQRDPPIETLVQVVVKVPSSVQENIDVKKSS